MIKQDTKCKVILLFTIFSIITTSYSEVKFHWRGLDYTGTSNDTNLPETWGKTENVKWIVNLPGESAATPAITDKYIFLPTSVLDNNEIKAICLEESTGKQLWELSFGTGIKNSKNTSTSPSPAIDDKAIYFLFRTGVVVKVDYAGKILWERRLTKEIGPFRQNFGYASSPLLIDNVLYVMSIGSPSKQIHSFIVALDTETGKTIWLHERKTDAIGETCQVYTSPVPYNSNGIKSLIVAGADALTCHNLLTGEEIWRNIYVTEQKNNWRLVPTPVVGDNIICSIKARGGKNSIFTLNPKKDEKNIDISWICESKYGPDVCSPAYYKEKFYILDGKKKVLLCIDPISGKVIWEQSLPGKGGYWASPTIAEDKLYCISKKGLVSIVKLGEKPTILSSIDTEEDQCYASIAIANNKIYIRTKTKLFCIKKMK